MSSRGHEDSEILLPDPVVAHYARTQPDIFEPTAAQTFFIVRATAQRMNDVSLSWLEPLGLTPLSFNVLSFLRAAHDGAMSLSAISRSLHTRPATITSLIDSLERDGWVTRAAHPRDRRTTLATLTPQGAAIVERASREQHRRIASVLSDVEPAERQQLVALMLRVNEGLMREKSALKVARRAS
jgi:DNA-binding MarR family transcriptional regulator